MSVVIPCVISNAIKRGCLYRGRERRPKKGGREGSTFSDLEGVLWHCPPALHHLFGYVAHGAVLLHVLGA